MFKLEPSPTFKFRVRLSVPGSEEPATLTLASWGKSAEGNEKDARFLMGAIVGWESVVDAEGKAVPFDETAFARAINNYPGAGLAILKAYARELNAGREKNS